MSRSFAIITLIFILMLSACNLPVNSQNEPDLIATQVANLLTLTPITSNPTQPTINSVVETQPSTATSTMEVTHTPTLTATPTTTSTPMGIPSGQASWSDPLENGGRFGLDASGYDDGNTKINIENGAMKITSIGAVGWRGWRLTRQNTND